jgi:cytochrome c2
MDEWLRQPGALVPGNGMAFAGIANDADRASLIAWLLANSGAN